MEQRNCLISCIDAGLGYDNKALIEHFDFQIYEGEYVCVLGENGSGKSTLLKTILGLIKPVEGQVTFGDSVKDGVIGYLPQQTQVQRNFPASVMEVVLSGFLNQMGIRPFYTKWEKQKAIRNMEKLGIADLRNKCYGTLSGGQQQRILLARALCATRELLVLDEPVTGLDPAAAATLYDNLRMLHEEGTSIVMVTHDLRNAVQEADKILHIDAGDYFYGTVQQYLDSDFSDIFS